MHLTLLFKYPAEADHRIVTSRAFLVHQTAGVFTGLGMGFKAVLTALLALILVRLFL